MSTDQPATVELTDAEMSILGHTRRETWTCEGTECGVYPCDEVSICHECSDEHGYQVEWPCVLYSDDLRKRVQWIVAGRIAGDES